MVHDDFKNDSSRVIECRLHRYFWLRKVFQCQRPGLASSHSTSISLAESAIKEASIWKLSVSLEWWLRKKHYSWMNLKLRIFCYYSDFHLTEHIWPYWPFPSICSIVKDLSKISHLNCLFDFHRFLEIRTLKSPGHISDKNPDVILSERD